MSGSEGDSDNILIPVSCRITVIQATGEVGKSFEFDTKNWCVLGSHRDCDIRIKHSLNAPLHALVLVRQEGVHLIGLHSDIPVNHPRTGTALVKEKEISLLPGDSFYLGDRGFRVDFEVPSVKCPKSPSLSLSQPLGPLTRGARKAASERKFVHRTESSERKRKSKRRVSLVVEAHSERFVSQNRDTERLLSKAQVARLSDGEGFQTPLKSMLEKDATHDQNAEVEEETQESRPQPSETSKNVQSHSEEDENDIKEESFKPDMALKENVSCDKTEAEGKDEAGDPSTSEEVHARKISLPPTPKTRNPLRVVKSASKQGTLTARERKQLIYARLSLGLTAHPSKNEKAGNLETNTAVISNAQTSDVHEHKLDLNLHQSNNQAIDQHISEKIVVRSPLADKSPILNIQRSAKRSEGVSKECRTPSAIKKCPGSVLRSSKSTIRGKKRSVAFAPKIELERGKHYSPFRPSVTRTTSFPAGSGSWVKQEIENTPTNLGRLSLDSTIGVSSDTHISDPGVRSLSGVEKDSSDDVEAASDLPSDHEKEAFEEEANRDSLTHASDSVSDSNSLKVGSSADSSASRLTGAITSLLKRLSGNGEQQRANGNSLSTSTSGKSRSIDCNSVKLGESKVSTEPLMSMDEIQDLSTSRQMSVSRRLSFIDKVFGAAAAVRNVVADSEEDRTVEDIGDGKQADSSIPRTEKANKDESSTEGAASCADGQAMLNSPRRDFDARESTSNKKADPGTDEDAGQVYESLAYEAEQLSSNALPSDVPSSDNLLALSDSKQRSSFGNILERLTRGTDEQGNETLQASEDEGSLDRTISYDSNSVSSQNTADTFERELEIRVNRASFLSRPSSTGEDLEELEAEIQFLTAEEETDSPLHEMASSSTGAELDRSHGERKTGVSSESEACLERDEEHQNEELVEIDRTDSESSPIVISPTSPNANCHRNTERCSSRIGPESKSCQEQVPEPSEGPRTFQEPSVSDTKTQQTDGEQNLERELNKLLVVELREKLRALNLSIVGRKAELIERLMQHLMQAKGDIPNALEPNTGGEDNKDMETSHVDGKGEESESTVIVIPSDSEQEADNEEETESHVELYRRKTVKELRQILKDRNLDIMSRLRKEELIQHMITEGINLPEHDQEASAAESPSSGRVLRSTRKTRQTPAVSRRSRLSVANGAPQTAKSLHRLTVAELRSLLREQKLCQQGTKRVLIERITSEGQSNDENAAANESKTNSTCKSCQADQVCEVENRT